MNIYTPPRVRKGCKVTLKNTETGDTIAYTIVNSMFDNSEWWKTPRETVKDLENVLSAKSPLGTELMGKQVGETVRKYIIERIEAIDRYVINSTDSRERIIEEKQGGLAVLLEKLQNGDWVGARIMEISPLYELAGTKKASIVPRYETLNGHEYLESIWITNQKWKKRDNYFRVVLWVYLGNSGATAEIVLSEDAVISCIHDGIVPMDVLQGEQKYVYDSSKEESARRLQERISLFLRHEITSLSPLGPEPISVHALEVMIDNQLHLKYRASSDSELDYYMCPAGPDEA